MAQKYFLTTFYSSSLILLLCLVSGAAQAQDRSDNNWVFSNGQWIQFNYSDDSLSTETANVPLPNGAGPNGAVATDPQNGEVLFYTDGTAIYDAQGGVVRTGLNGDPNQKQQVAIVPVNTPNPNGTRQYRVYVNEGGTLRYYTVTVDTSNPGYPVVASTDPAQTTGVANISGPITVLAGNDGTYHVLAQEANSPTYRLVNTTTDIPQTLNLGSQGAGNITANGFAYNPSTGQIAVSSPTGVHILNFDPATAGITFSSGIAGNVDDVAWSADGSKLYVNTGGTVRQYDFTNNQSVSTIPGISNAEDLKLGPDGNLYFLYDEGNDGTYQLGRLLFADSAASQVAVESPLFDGADFGSPIFPAVAPAPAPSYEFTVNPTTGCANQPVQLVSELGPDTPTPDSIVWSVNGQSYYGISPAFTPEQAVNGGTATAYWTRDDSVYTSTQNVPLTVSQFDLQIPLVQDTTICPDETATLKAQPESGGGQQGGGGGVGGGQTGGGNYSYYWSTGETTDSIQVDRAGVYWVLVTDPSTGCTAYAESNVKEYQLENQTYNTWYFGNGAGIDFNTLYVHPEDPPSNTAGQITPLGDGAQMAPEAVASVSDNNGDILFYTDGESVFFYDRVAQQHSQVSTGIGGDPGASQVAIVPVPEADGVYYIFTTTAVENGGYELRYSVFDLRQQQVTSSNNLLFVKSTEKIAIVGGNGNDAVLIAHEYGNNVFRSYPITANGIGTPVTSAVGTVYRSPDEADPAAEDNDAQGYLSVGGDSTGTVVAAALGNEIEIYSFADSTLKLSDPVTVPVPNGTPYGVFVSQDSLGNRVVLISTDNGLYVTDALQEGVTPGLNPVSGTAGSSFGAIQQGSDGQIYVAQDGSNYLGTVSVNANDPANSSYNAQAVELPNGATVGLGLPTEVKMGGNSFPEPSISVENACTGGEISFAAQGRDDVIETYFWEIITFNGTDSLRIGLPDSLATEQTFTYAIDSMGEYIARVTLSNRCDEDSIMEQRFTVSEGPQITLPESILLCNGTQQITAVEEGDTTGLTVTWVLVGAQGGGNLPSQNTITVDAEGLYQVTVTTPEGCTSEGEVFVADNRPEIQLPNDFTLCGDETRQLDVEIPSPDPQNGYAWVILNESGAVATTSDEPVIDVRDLTPDPGIYTYTVTVTDDSPEGCFVQDTVVVSILAAPEIEGVTTDPSSCDVNSPDGSIDVTVADNGDGPYTFVWRDENGSLLPDTEDLNNLTAGVYTLTVTNAAGCSATESFGLDNSTTFEPELVDTIPGCDDDNALVISINDPAASPTTSFEVVLSGPDGYRELTNALANDNFTIPTPNTLMPPGVYNVSVRDAAGCLRTLTNIEIPEPDSLDFNVERRFVNSCTPDTLSIAFTQEVLTWDVLWTNVTPGAAADEGIVGSRTDFETIVAQSGTYEVRAYNPATPELCPATRQVEVTISEPVDIQAIALDEDNSCETGERQLTVQFANPADSARQLTYRWNLDGQPFPAYTRTITVTESGNYAVTAQERNSTSATCTATEAVDVAVSEPVSGIPSLLYGPACEGSSSLVIARANLTDTLTFAWYDSANTLVRNTEAVGGDTLVITPEMPVGQFTVEISTPDGCVVERQASIRRNPSPMIRFIDNGYFICDDPIAEPEDQTVTVEIEPVQGTVTWTYISLGGIATDITNTGQTPFEVPASAEGYYQVTVANPSGCAMTDSVLVTADCSPSVVAPNAIRPGGTNNRFSVYHRYVAEEGFEVRIYNRWGELIYQSNNPDFEWDGTYKGRAVPLGSYPYVINYKSTTDEGEEGRTYQQRGGVTVLR